MKSTQSIFTLILLFLTFSCDNEHLVIEPPLCGEGLTQINGECILVCDEGYTIVNSECTIVCEEGFTGINGECYSQDDLDILPGNAIVNSKYEKYINDTNNYAYVDSFFFYLSSMLLFY